MDPKIEVFARPSGDVEVRTTFNAFFISEIQRRLPEVIVEKAAAALCEKFIADKGTAIIATIDLKDVLNSAVAKVVTRLSEESRK